MAKFMAASRTREWMPAWTMPWGLQASGGGGPGGLDPAQVLAVDPVALEGGPDQADDLHAAVAQPAVHVLHPSRHGGHRSARLCPGLGRRRRPARVDRYPRGQEDS